MRHDDLLDLVNPLVLSTDATASVPHGSEPWRFGNDAPYALERFEVVKNIESSRCHVVARHLQHVLIGFSWMHRVSGRPLML